MSSIPQTGKALPLADICAYTIVSPDKLEEAVREHKALPEKKRWVSVLRYLKQARKEGRSLPVIFADARHCTRLIAWSTIDDLVIKKSTKISVSKLYGVGSATRDRLTVLATGKPIPAGHVRPYVICKTPHFLLSLARKPKPWPASKGSDATAETDSPQLPVSSVGSTNAASQIVPTELTEQERSDPFAAERVLARLFAKTSGAAKRRYLDFLADDLDYLSQHHPDRWGVTLFSSLVRLNAGMVECLVLHPGGLRVLVDKASAPAGTAFEEVTYRSAPGCAMASVRLSEIPAVLPLLVVAHHSALSIAARRECTLQIRRAHSVGVTRYLAQTLNRLVGEPVREAENYWVVKGRPAENDFGRLEAGIRATWHTGRPPKDWARGDRLFFWRTAPSLDVVGIGEFLGLRSGAKPSGESLFNVRYLSPMLSAPVGIQQLREDPTFGNATFLKSGPSGTVFPLTLKQGERIYALVCRQNPFAHGVWPEVPGVARGADVLPDLDTLGISATEGRRKLVSHLRLERDHGLVEAKKRTVLKANGNLACEVCMFDFVKHYGRLGEGFCEVHHRKVLSKTVGERVTNLKDLAVVCSNCHRMLHRGGKLISIEKLRLTLSSA